MVRLKIQSRNSILKFLVRQCVCVCESECRGVESAVRAPPRPRRHPRPRPSSGRSVPARSSVHLHHGAATVAMEMDDSWEHHVTPLQLHDDREAAYLHQDEVGA